MTINEYQNKMDQLTDEEFIKFCKNFGGESNTREKRVREFVDHPEHERRICQLLNLKTEEEKITEATIKSAEASSISAESAKSSVNWARVACAISSLALIVSIIALLIKANG